MSARGRRVAESPSCPLLGLLDDQASRFSYSSVGHRCYADGRLRTIDLSHQGSFCLVATYPECPRYRAAAASGRPGVATPKASGVALGRVRAEAGASGVPGAPGEPGASGEPGRQPPGRTSPRLRIAAIIIAVAVLAGATYLGSPAIVDWLRQVGAGMEAASTSPSTTPTPTATRVPTATTTPALKRTATPLVHVVARGETINAIAARYGITLAALEKANGIKDPNLIYVGQRLVIPDR